MIIDKFDPNLILVNINKFKPYRFVNDHTLQPILIKPSEFYQRNQWSLPILISCSSNN
jgi:hypothetical protein